MEIIEFLKDKKIAILGFGKQGRATCNFIRKKFPNKEIEIRDKNENLKLDFKDEKINLKCGKNYLEGLENFDLIIKAPGVVLQNEDISKFEDKIITDYEILLKTTEALTIGITGSKGKSTTCTLIYNMLKEQNKKVLFLGNIGNPVFDYIDEIDENTIIVLEVSSHTLEFVKSSPKIAVLLDIFPEHLDHSGTINNYVNAKFNIAAFQNENDYFIYNGENDLMKEHNFKYKENDIFISLNNVKANVKNRVYLENGKIYFNDKFLMNESEEREIKGKHMLNNMMFILAISEILKLDITKTIKTLKNTKPLEHRMEYVGEFNGIHFYNDSIATIPEATINCIETIGNVDTLICGGLDRKVKQDKLIEYLKNSNVQNVICMPETGYFIYDELKEIKNVYKIEDLEEAVKLSKKITKKGLSCVLSPSAASYSHFKNFEEKGKMFKEFVRR